MKTRATGCVYCGCDGPYTDEHVIPAGLGAGDALLLKGVVCRGCNDHFSRLEGRILRHGDIGLGRLMFQEFGRARGSRTRPPTFNATATMRIEGGVELEVALGYRLAAGVVPQVVQSGDQLHGSGGTREQMEGFLDHLDAMLGDSIVLIRKAASGSQFVRFEASLGRCGYTPGQPQLVATPDKQAFWIETRDEGADGGAARRVLQRAASIAVQVAGADAARAAEFLSALKANLTRLRGGGETNVRSADLQQPDVHVSVEMPSEDEVAQLLAKIGFNLLVHLHGDARCRDPLFDDLCNFVLTGSPERLKAVWTGEDDVDGIRELMKHRFSGRHWMMLFSLPNRVKGVTGIAFVCCLYGGATRSVHLVDVAPPEMARAETVFAVNYETHQVELISFNDLVASMQGEILQALAAASRR